MSEQEPQTVLMVDDSESDAYLVAEAMKKAPFACRFKSLTSAEAAAAYLLGDKPYANRGVHPLPDLMLLDIEMPGTDGFSLLQWVRAQEAEWARLPVIMLTMSQDFAKVRRAYDMGANSFLVKPARYDELQRMIADMAAYWLSHNRAASDVPQPAAVQAAQ